MKAARTQPYRSSILVGAVLGALLIGAAVPRGAAAVSCDADIRGVGPSGWSVNGTLGTFDNGVLFTDGLDAVRDDAFDNGGQAGVDDAAYINPDPSGCRRVIHGRGVNFPSAIVNGIKVKPKLYFEAKRPVARSLVLLTNPGASLRTIEYSIDGEPGSDAATKVGTTSNGNATVEVGDAWATTCEDKANNGCTKTGGADVDRDPELAHNWERQGTKPDSADAFEIADGLDDYDVRFIHVNIDPGQTVAFMDVETMAPTITRANRFARRAGTHPGEVGLFYGMSKRERAELRNW
jgi:hypothetical protein